MRTRTAQDIALFSAGLGCQTVWIKVEIDRTGAGAWVDLSDWNGIDFVRGVTYSETLDTPAWGAQVMLSAWDRDRPELSLSPGMTTSILNTGGVLCKLHNRIRISTATCALDTPRSAASYVKVFEGRIDRFTVSDGSVSLDCRDKTGDLQDFFIEAERRYGSDTPASATDQDVEEVIQNLIDDHYNANTDIGGTVSLPRTSALASRTTNGSPYHLYSDDGDSTTPFKKNTTASVRAAMQTKMPLWQALQANADKIQWLLRFRYHEGSGVNDFVLVLEQPDRTKTTADFTVDPKTTQARILSYEQSIDWIRNVVRGTAYTNGVTAISTEVNDSTSRSDYGRRFMEMDVGSTSQIDTSTELSTLVNAALDDTQDPYDNMELVIPYAYWVQLNDLIAVDPDDIHIDTQRKVAVLSRTNSITQGAAGTTTLTCRGKPKAKSVSEVVRQRGHRMHWRAPQPLRTSLSGSGKFRNSTFASLMRQ